MTDSFYLDHAAATPVDARVVAAMEPYLTSEFYNPSSPYLPAVHVRHAYEDAKSRLASSFGGRGADIIMTAGATESINIAFSGIEGHIVTSAIEHDAVLAAAKLHTFSLVQPSPLGVIDPGKIQEAIHDDTELVSVQLANNELGTIQPIRAIAQVIDEIRRKRISSGVRRQLLLHCDASQGFGSIDVHVGRLNIDLLTLNAAKIYGPKQVGLLWARSGTVLTPSIVGGGQERGIRSGTENVAGTIGFAKAVELAVAHRAYENKRLTKLRDDMQHALQDKFTDMIVSGHPKKRLAGSLHVSFPGLDAERLIFSLETHGVLLATGSACAANKGTRSHVLTAIGLDADAADGSLRISLGKLSDDKNCLQATEIISQVVAHEYERVGTHA